MDEGWGTPEENAADSSAPSESMPPPPVPTRVAKKRAAKGTEVSESKPKALKSGSWSPCLVCLKTPQASVIIVRDTC